MLVFDGVSFSYKKKRVLDGLSFRAAPGECVVLWGANGVGKSTVLSLAAGVLSPDGGTIVRDGGVGYVPQGVALPEDMTVSECLRFFARLKGCEVPRELPFSVEAVRGKRISALSGGMKKQVSIACAMPGDPAVILLDEPCAALDLVFRDEMLRAVEGWKAAGKTILYVSHDPAEFYSCFDALLMLGREQRLITRASLGEIADDPIQLAAFCKNAL